MNQSHFSTIHTEDYILLNDYSKPIVAECWYFSNQAPRYCTEVREGDYPYGRTNDKGEIVHDFKTWSGQIVGYLPLHDNAIELKGIPLLTEQPEQEEYVYIYIAALVDKETSAELSGRLRKMYEKYAYLGYKAAPAKGKYSDIDLQQAAWEGCQFGRLQQQGDTRSFSEWYSEWHKKEHPPIAPQQLQFIPDIENGELVITTNAEGNAVVNGHWEVLP